MLANRFCSVICLIAVLGIANGCVATSAPDGWLPDSEEMEREAYGGWVEVSYKHEGIEKTIEGELIAAESTLLYVLSDSGVHVVSSSDITEADLMGYEIHAGRLGGWMLLGVASTLTHGFYLVLSVPGWLLTSGISAASTSREPLISYPDHPLLAFRLYARFPQGLPSAIDPRTLKRRPYLPE